MTLWRMFGSKILNRCSKSRRYYYVGFWSGGEMVVLCNFILDISNIWMDTVANYYCLKFSCSPVVIHFLFEHMVCSYSCHFRFSAWLHICESLNIVGSTMNSRVLWMFWFLVSWGLWTLYNIFEHVDVGYWTLQEVSLVMHEWFPTLDVTSKVINKQVQHTTKEASKSHWHRSMEPISKKYNKLSRNFCRNRIFVTE